MTAAPLRVGVIGLGVGSAHAEAFARHPECLVAGLADRRGEARRAARDEHPGAAVVPDWSGLLDLGLDAVAIASFDDDHAEQVVAALGAGLHVLCEKPLCRTAAEADAIRRAAAKRPGVVVASNLVLRAAPLWRRLVGEIAGGGLGRVYAVDADYLYGRLDKITEGWRGRIEDYSVMLGGGVHMMDLAMLLLGERPSAVSGAGSGIATEGSGFAPDDYTAATLRFPSGAVGRVTANFGCVHRHQHVVRVFGTEATVIVDEQGARRYRERDPGGPAEWLPEDPLPDHKGALVPAFVDAALGRESPLPGLEHELAVIAACLAADRAAAAGGTAPMPQETVEVNEET